MKPSQPSRLESGSGRAPLSNGSGAAALLAAGIGVLMLAVLALAAGHSAAFKSAMIFYKPTGPLSGVTTSALIAWLVVWVILNARWQRRSVPLGRVAVAALVLLVLGLALTFPPLASLL